MTDQRNQGAARYRLLHQAAQRGLGTLDQLTGDFRAHPEQKAQVAAFLNQTDQTASATEPSTAGTREETTMSTTQSRRHTAGASRKGPSATTATELRKALEAAEGGSSDVAAAMLTALTDIVEALVAFHKNADETALVEATRNVRDNLTTALEGSDEAPKQRATPAAPAQNRLTAATRDPLYDKIASILKWK
ncbi:hypothetical protein [Aestuariimicrobium sp. Y1814]|uniref:hypothetical protein n=1 Tax=Aestuariimicrobium sp. Y1814 TaxID=3418742 RepID=UPI003DA6CFC4